jgi:hypothetical protein
MKTTFNKIFFAVFIVLWAAAAVANLLKPRREFSENENRYLAAFPKYTFESMVNGKFMNKVEDYVNDQFLVRDFWVSAQSGLEYLIGKRENNGVYIGSGALIGKIGEPNRDFISMNIEGVEHFALKTDMPVSLIIVPSAAEIQSRKLPAFAKEWDQKAEIDRIYASVKSAKCISVYDILSAHADEYIFYRTDHHWTTYGAYLAYTAYCSANGISPADYCAETVSSSFDGTLYSKSGVRFIKSDTLEAFLNGFATHCDVFNGKETVSRSGVYFPEYLDKKDKYAYFLGQNQPVVTIYGENENGPRLLMFKDSYAHCMAPMLLENYSLVTLVDLRYINVGLDNFVDIGEYDSALFLLSIETFANQSEVYKLTRLLK